MPKMTISKLADRHGVTRRTVERWARRGFVVRRENGAIDVKATDATLRTMDLGRFRLESGSRSHGASDSDVHHRKQFALMRRRELEVQRLEEKLVDARLHSRELRRLVDLILRKLASAPKRRAREIAEKLGVNAAQVAAAFHAAMQAELQQLRQSLSEDG